MSSPYLVLMGGPFDGCEGICDFAGLPSIWVAQQNPNPNSYGVSYFHATLTKHETCVGQIGERSLYVLDHFDGGRYVYRVSSTTLDEDLKTFDEMLLGGSL